MAAILPVLFLSFWLWLAARWLRGAWRRGAQARFIEVYAWPPGLYAHLHRRRPGLADRDCERVGQALRQFFLAHLDSGRAFVSMPSQAADDLWHAFILHTPEYAAFCQRAFGGLLRHVPAAVLGPDQRSNAGLRRVWWFACQREGIDPRRPARLPPLFGLDAALAWPEGFRYVADCQGFRQLPAGDPARGRDRGVVHCGGDFASSDFDGGITGLGDHHGYHGHHEPHGGAGRHAHDPGHGHGHDHGHGGDGHGGHGGDGGHGGGDSGGDGGGSDGGGD